MQEVAVIVIRKKSVLNKSGKLYIAVSFILLILNVFKNRITNDQVKNSNKVYTQIR